MKHTKLYLFIALAMLCLLLAGCTEDALPPISEQPDIEDSPVIIYDAPVEAEEEPGFVIEEPEEETAETIIPSDEEAPEETIEPEDAPEEAVLPPEETEPVIIIPAEIVEEMAEEDPEALDEPEEHDNSPPAPAIDVNGSYTSKEDVALYLHTYRHLPKNFITKKEAEAQGWTGGGLKDGMCIGGSYFGNYEGILPKNAEYHECDIDTMNQKKRGVKRLVWSTKGAIYYTDDHYETFTLLYEEWAK